MSEHEWLFNRAVSDSDSAAEAELEIPTKDEQLPPTPKRPPTVRFNVEEARVIAAAVAAAQFDGRGWGDEYRKLSPVIARRLITFIEKHSTKETS